MGYWRRPQGGSVHGMLQQDLHEDEHEGGGKRGQDCSDRAIEDEHLGPQNVAFRKAMLYQRCRRFIGTVPYLCACTLGFGSYPKRPCAALCPRPRSGMTDTSGHDSRAAAAFASVGLAPMSAVHRWRDHHLLAILIAQQHRSTRIGVGTAPNPAIPEAGAADRSRPPFPNTRTEPRSPSGSPLTATMPASGSVLQPSRSTSICPSVKTYRAPDGRA